MSSSLNTEIRLDQLLVEKGFARSRTQASDLIKSGKVKVLKNKEMSLVLKTSFKCSLETKVEVDLEDEFLWVSRSGEKLNLALKKLHLDFNNLKVLDIGQSTGGFSECALSAGAREVVGVDVGTSQLSEKLKKEQKLTFYEGLDARELIKSEKFNHSEFDFLVMDLSFISFTKVLASVLPLLKTKKGAGLVLVKPQFEVGRSKLKKGGLVEGNELLLDCQRGIFRIINEMREIEVIDYFPSGLRGKDGNQEFFCFFKMS